MSEEIASTNALIEEIARLQTDLAIMRDQLRDAKAAEEAERAARVRWERALAWYADPHNYDAFDAPGVLDPQQGTWHMDGGDRARAALERKGSE